MTAQDIRFFQTFTYVLAALVGFTIFIYILAKLVDGNTQDVWSEADPARRALIEERTAPVGKVALKGEAQVSVVPNDSSLLTFREQPASTETHGDDAGHGEGGHGDGHDNAMADAKTESSHGGGEGHGEQAIADGAQGQEEEAVSAEPVAAPAAEVADAGAGAADTSGIDGQAIYNQGCVACHAAGIAGAPKVGDAAAWEARVAQGNEVLYEHAINGYNTMPAKGGLSFLSDDQVKAAVNFMVSQL